MMSNSETTDGRSDEDVAAIDEATTEAVQSEDTEAETASADEEASTDSTEPAADDSDEALEVASDTDESDGAVDDEALVDVADEVEVAAELAEATDDGAEAELAEATDDGAEAELAEATDDGAEAELAETTDDGAEAALAETTDDGAEAALAETTDDGAEAALAETTDDDAEAALAEATDDGAEAALAETTNDGAETALAEATDDDGDTAEEADDFFNPSNPAMKWYVVHTYSGYENRAHQCLLDRVVSEGAEDMFGKILIPTEEVVEMKKGAKRITTRKFFPGYMLVQMELTTDTWHLVKSTQKITGFVGGTSRMPRPIPDSEVRRITAQISDGAEKPKLKETFEEGSQVRVTDGPFMNFTGSVEEVRPEKQKLRVLVSIFGRATPVELDFIQVERL